MQDKQKSVEVQKREQIVKPKSRRGKDIEI